MEFNIIKEFHHLCPVTSITWSPLASSDTVPKVINKLFIFQLGLTIIIANCVF